jgi:hypothetical protein
MPLGVTQLRQPNCLLLVWALRSVHPINHWYFFRFASWFGYIQHSRSVFAMQLSHRPGSLQSSVRQWVSTTEDWLGGRLRNVGVADIRRTAEPIQGISARAAAPIEMTMAIVSESAAQAETARLALIYSAERRLQLAHAVNDRETIALIRAELDSLL